MVPLGVDIVRHTRNGRDETLGINERNKVVSPYSDSKAHRLLRVMQEVRSGKYLSYYKRTRTMTSGLLPRQRNLETVHPQCDLTA